MKLYKPWVWRENAIMYDHPSKVVHEPYPFYWYRVTDLEIELVKQISKNCGVVQDWNRWVSEVEPIEVEPIQNNEIEHLHNVAHRDEEGWIWATTFGSKLRDPLDRHSTFEWGNKKVELSFTQNGYLEKRIEYEDNKIISKGEFKYTKFSDQFLDWCEYTNSDGIFVEQKEEKVEKKGDRSNMDEIYKKRVKWVEGKSIEAVKEAAIRLAKKNRMAIINKQYGTR